MDKTIRRVTDPIEQELETLRYWQSRSVGERLVAVCELSEAAYSLKADFRGAAGHDDEGSERPSSHLQRKRG
ncbi:MAG TPA: hypothetical protein VK720_07970 [Terracidiphilus sp.]|nr:hypothetical protein [Terracidiphilus sp.]